MINRCPKCGREPVSTEESASEFYLGWRVECLKCKLQTAICGTRDDVIAKWNEITKRGKQMKQLKRSECSVLPLVLKGKWYDMIASGEKKEEYRDAKPFWRKRITNVIYKSHNEDEPIVVAFSRGYKKQDMFFIVDKILYADGSDHPEWGEPETTHYVIKLGERVELVN